MTVTADGIKIDRTVTANGIKTDRLDTADGIKIDRTVTADRIKTDNTVTMYVCASTPVTCSRYLEPMHVSLVKNVGLPNPCLAL